MKTNPESALSLKRRLANPNVFVARLILAELLAKRGTGPLERKTLKYIRRRPT
ncbi:MAG: hypothetical protein AAGF92_04745 [Myxococcota bacterium]